MDPSTVHPKYLRSLDSFSKQKNPFKGLNQQIPHPDEDFFRVSINNAL